MRRLALPSLLLAVGLAASACSGDVATTGSGSTAIEVLDIAPILDGDPVFTTGANGLVTMQVSTTQNVGCNIVFGPDDTYGTLATDVDMSDGAHADHVVILGMLTPGEVVHYRLQGAAPDGTLYQAHDDRTFVVPELGASSLATGDPAAAADGRTNVALGADVTASSEFNASFGASNAVDGNPATEWSSLGDGDDAWIEIDLGAPTEISGVGFWTRDMSDGTAIIEMIRILVDGEEIGVFAVGPDLTVIEGTATGQIVRIEAQQTTGGNTGAVEVEVYGA